MQLFGLGSERVSVEMVPQQVVWREVLSRGGGNHDKPATVHHPAPVTLIVSGELKYLSAGGVGGCVERQATL